MDLSKPTPPQQESKHLTHPKYRPDIDGLRAIAVLSVVGFHAFPFLVKGGFIGVDIFFVISGYLISTIIFGNLESNTFSFVEFYSRRIKRIFPALILVLIACFTFGWFALLADEYKQLGKHIAGGAAFISNFIFWNESGYFDNSAETKPLLHLWTLGIEEQFYIVWPVLLWASWKQKFNLLTITIVIATVSFVLNMKGLHSDAIATFYSPQSRFWELLLGSVLAYATLYKQDLLVNQKHKLDMWLSAVIYANSPNKNGNTLRNMQSLLGAALIGIGILIITKERHFPGTWALLPTLGAVLIISAGSQAWVNRVILSNRILVWFGLISFPLYLWHWPLLSFSHIVESTTPTREIRISAVFVSVILAYLTYKLLEKPIRLGNYGNIKTITLTVLMVVVGFVGYNTHKQDGNIFGKQSNLVMNEEEIQKERAGYWNGETETNFQTKNPKVIVFGDSQAFDIYKSLKNEKKIGLKLFKHSYKCSAFFSPDIGLESKLGETCKIAFDVLLNSKQLTEADTLIYSHYWSVGMEHTDNYKFAVLQIKEKNPNIKIFFLGPKPLIGKSWISINAITKNHQSIIGMNDFLNKEKWIRDDATQYAKKIALDVGVTFIDVNTVFCKKDCPFFFENKFSNFDQNHWTEFGAKKFYDNLLETEHYIHIVNYK